MSSSNGDPPRILIVCTGNICRSPVAEYLWRRGLASTSTPNLIQVSSAGTDALVGHPVQAEMSELLARDGIHPRKFAARQVSSEIVTGADLILVAAREHRQRLIRLRPSALAKSFTLKEFARLSSLVAIPDSQVGASPRLRWLIAWAPMARGREDVPPENDDIVDPYMQDAATYKAAYEAIHLAVSTIVSRLD